ncbi:MAG: STAS domain-containing protein [Acidimicrobiales bacterium]
MTGWPNFDVSVVSNGVGRSVDVVVTGELDLATAPKLRRELLAVVGSGMLRLTVDLRGVDFIDAAGIGALVEGANAASRQGVDLVVRRPSRSVRRLFDVLALHGVLPEEGSRA